MAKLLKKADILKRAEKAFEPRTVFVPDWEGSLRYRPMSMAERRQVRQRCMVPGTDAAGNATQEMDQEMMEIWAIITCVLDPEDDKRFMFGPEDFDFLENKIESGCLSVVSIAILRASGLGPDSFRGGEDTSEEGSGTSSDDATVQGEKVLVEGS